MVLGIEQRVSNRGVEDQTEGSRLNFRQRSREMGKRQRGQVSILERAQRRVAHSNG